MEEEEEVEKKKKYWVIDKRAHARTGVLAREKCTARDLDVCKSA
jgi:hypothetical protein